MVLRIYILTALLWLGVWGIFNYTLGVLKLNDKQRLYLYIALTVGSLLILHFTGNMNHIL